jgi:hypothetical protein
MPTKAQPRPGKYRSQLASASFGAAEAAVAIGEASQYPFQIKQTTSLKLKRVYLKQLQATHHTSR